MTAFSIFGRKGASRRYEPKLVLRMCATAASRVTFSRLIMTCSEHWRWHRDPMLLYESGERVKKRAFTPVSRWPITEYNFKVRARSEGLPWLRPHRGAARPSQQGWGRGGSDPGVCSGQPPQNLLARRSSLVGLSRPCPFISIANCDAIPRQQDFI